MTTLGDAPGGTKLIEALTNAVKDLSLCFAGIPDEKAEASLRDYVERIEPELVADVGAGPARIILQGFAAAVMGEKHKIEAQGASRA